ncbi:MAG: glycoside hydrolase family 9 protein [Spirochaetales bacterium]|nr:glycoside hydrolase family 9 protein [Spirochaetales bacterium]
MKGNKTFIFFISVISLFSLIVFNCLRTNMTITSPGCAFSKPGSDRAVSMCINVNQIGYLIDRQKCFWLSNIDIRYHKRWFLIDEETDDEVLSGVIAGRGSYDPLSRDIVERIDFSHWNKSGSYYIRVNNLGRSHSFMISDTVFNDVFYAAARSFYYQRSGMALSSECAGIWSRPAAHTRDAYLYDGCDGTRITADVFRQSTGGWYDAGDFGKKIVPAAAALYSFFRLFELYRDRIEGVSLDIPESGNTIPDLLDEAKYELSWFLSMQRPDGAVHHLIASPNFHFDMPDTDFQTRYIVTVSTTATADFCAVMAMASRAFLSCDPSFAGECLAAAENAWNFLENHQTILPPDGYRDPPCINETGGYGDTDDTDERLWAAAEMFRAAGTEKYGTYFTRHYMRWSPAIRYPFNWRDVHNNGMFSYVLETRNSGPDPVRDTIITDILHYADTISDKAFHAGYGIALKEGDFYWGSNAIVLAYALELILADELAGGRPYLPSVLDHLNYILGTNALGKCFVTGCGKSSVTDPLQAASPYDGLAEPVPGFVVGGPNRYGGDYDLVLNRYIAENAPPPAKSYIDDHRSFSCNEVALCYTAPLVFLAGYFYGPAASR